VGVGVLALLSLGAPVSAGVEAGISDIRFWDQGDVTRIVVEVRGDFTYVVGKVEEPQRIFIDLHGAVPMLEGKRDVRARTIEARTALLQQIRVALMRPKVSRIVFDLQAPAEISISELVNPDRLVVDLSPAAAKEEKLASVQAEAKAQPGRVAVPTPHLDVTPPQVQPAALKELPPPPPLITESRNLPAPAPSPARDTGSTKDAGKARTKASRTSSKPSPPAAPTTSAGADSTSSQPIPTAGSTASQAAKPPLLASASPPRTSVVVVPPATVEPPPDLQPAVPARPKSDGNRSLIRAMGLKVGRVVIDPGHGGHDTGTISRSGAVEKDIALDIALRLGALIQDGLGHEVFYTRTDDTFVPLEERTRLANEKKADLFISVHLNSSRSRSISGTETFFLRFTRSQYALDIAARENASTNLSVHELQDLVRKIATTEKVEESREFALRVQGSMHGELAKAVRSAKNRGVKQAPFVVLIGASMPSILVEVGFLSNPREESLLKKDAHRQRVAEALYRGLSQYASTLSQPQVVRQSGPASP